ncbi:MAG: pantoate--beta-alanine ligase [Verrucomicrobiota bacterium]
MKTLRHAGAMQRLALRWRREGRSVAFVPTMGALHRGHLSLVTRARREAEIVVVSVYVNPTQFDRTDDLRGYPRTLPADRKACAAAGVEVVFAPANLYAEDHSTWVEETELSQGRCGATRPGHFRGVTTIVLKLVQLVQPERMYMGWKDAQQLEILRRMLRDLNVPTRVIGCPIVRDADGLALSSRNRHLSPAQRAQALALPRGLLEATGKARPAAWLRRHLARQPGLRVDYVEVAQGRLAAAVWVGSTRLIDNVPLPRVQRKGRKA